MNNNPENNNENNDIDDILDILKKRREEDSRKSVSADPTRVTNRIIVPDHEAFKEKKGEEQSSMFEDGTSVSFDVVSDEKSTKADGNSKTAEIVIDGTVKNTDKADASPKTEADISSDTVSKPETAGSRSLDTGIEPPKNTLSTTFSVMPEKSKKAEDTPEKAKPESIKKTAPAAPSAAVPVKKPYRVEIMTVPPKSVLKILTVSRQSRRKKKRKPITKYLFRDM